MIGILKFLRGFVQIKVWGFAPERFLNLCSNKNILLWDIKKDGDIYYMSISLSGFKKLKGIARKTRVRVVILKRCGLPFLLPKILEKKIFIAGLMLACFFWYWSSLYVWEITIEGNTAITEDMFSDFLNEHGVYVGIKSSKVDIEQLEKDIRKEFGEITWTSAKLSGTELIISVKENDAILEPVQEMGSADLYAPKEGIIVEMIVRSGVPQVKIGDTIEAAEAVASGECEKGIVVCTTGIGISMAANKVAGVRCALCQDTFSAKMTRLHNNANMLALGGGIVGPNLALDIVETFLNTPFSEEEKHCRRIGLLE